jgi:hypothetical protein
MSDTERDINVAFLSYKLTDRADQFRLGIKVD